MKQQSWRSVLVFLLTFCMLFGAVNGTAFTFALDQPAAVEEPLLEEEETVQADLQEEPLYSEPLETTEDVEPMEEAQTEEPLEPAEDVEDADIVETLEVAEDTDKIELVEALNDIETVEAIDDVETVEVLDVVETEELSDDESALESLDKVETADPVGASEAEEVQETEEEQPAQEDLALEESDPLVPSLQDTTSTRSSSTVTFGANVTTKSFGSNNALWNSVFGGSLTLTIRFYEDDSFKTTVSSQTVSVSEPGTVYFQEKMPRYDDKGQEITYHYSISDGIIGSHPLLMLHKISANKTFVADNITYVQGEEYTRLASSVMNVRWHSSGNNPVLQGVFKIRTGTEYSFNLPTSNGQAVLREHLKTQLTFVPDDTLEKIVGDGSGSAGNSVFVKDTMDNKVVVDGRTFHVATSYHEITGGEFILTEELKVTFDAGEGKMDVNPKTVNVLYNSTLSDSDIPTPTPPAQKKFLGWKCKDGDQIFAPSDSIPVTSNLDLVAVYGDDTITITVKTDKGGTLISQEEDQKIEVRKGTSWETIKHNVEPQVKTNDGYVFAYWSAAIWDAPPITESRVFDKDTTVYAIHRKPTVLVAYKGVPYTRTFFYTEDSSGFNEVESKEIGWQEVTPFGFEDTIWSYSEPGGGNRGNLKLEVTLTGTPNQLGLTPIFRHYLQDRAGNANILMYQFDIREPIIENPTDPIPEDFVTVVFHANENGKLNSNVTPSLTEQDTITYAVHKDVTWGEFQDKVPTIVPNEGYALPSQEATYWNKNADGSGGVANYLPTGDTKVSASTYYAQYMKIAITFVPSIASEPCGSATTYYSYKSLPDELKEWWDKAKITLRDQEGNDHVAVRKNDGTTTAVIYGNFKKGDTFTLFVENFPEIYYLPYRSSSPSNRLMVDGAAPYKVTFNHDAYAEHRLHFYIGRVSFDPNGGTWEDGTTDSVIKPIKSDNHVDFPKDPTPKTGYTFVSWHNKTSSGGEGAQVDPESKFFSCRNLVAKYLPNVVPTDPEDPQTPEKYVLVTFDKGEHGTLSGDVAFNVLIGTPFSEIPLPEVTADIGWSHSGWSPALPLGSAEITVPATYTATYAKTPDIIPVDPTDPVEPPAGYVTVEFLKGAHGEFKDGAITKYYVNPTAGKTIGDLTKPVVLPNLGYDFTNWDKEDTLAITANVSVTALYSKLPDVIPSNGSVTAKKVWKDAPQDKPVIWFALYRHIEGGKPEAVPGADIKKLDGITSVTWSDLEETDQDGNAYIFTVMEVDQNGKDFVPKGYKKVENGLVVTNTNVEKKLPSTGGGEQGLYLVIGLTMLLAAYFVLRKQQVS